MSAPQIVQDKPMAWTIEGCPIDEMLAIETARDWPGQREAYRRALCRLAALLRAEDAGARRALRAKMNGWFQGLLNCRDDAERQARRCALDGIVVDSERTPLALEIAADRLGKAPNLMSFLRARIIWDAGDTLESTRRRHARREVVFDPAEYAGQASTEHSPRRMEARVLVGQIARHASLTAKEQRVLTMIAAGDPIAEAARRTGRSRQQIYRLLERLRDWIKGAAA